MTAAKIWSVPTVYNGVEYRSKLESDWAATFDALGIYFEYEPQPWRMPSGAVYDCDFYLPTMNTYCEAKGPHNDRIWKPQEFAAALAATEFPNAFQVLVLRPAGRGVHAAWDTAVPNAPIPPLVECGNCLLAAFTDTWDNGNTWYCRRCRADVAEGSRVYYSALFGMEAKNLPRYPMVRTKLVR